jgi:hypothetical protein
MGQGRTLLCGLLVGLLAGCATGKPGRVGSWLDGGAFQGPTGPDVIHLDVALIERPADDPYLAREVWQLADEQLVPLERRPILHESGFRVGLISGFKPAELQTLLCSENSCADPRRYIVHAGRDAELPLGPAHAVCRFEVPQGGETASVILEQATSSLNVVPSLSADGQVRLHFTPQMRYGDTVLAAHAAEDNSGIRLQAERPRKSYPGLGWEVALSPNQYLIIGGRVDRPESLGCQCFLRRDESVPVQRLLVIRASRTSADGSQAVPLEDQDVKTGRIPTLALQAGWTSARLNMP